MSLFIFLTTETRKSRMAIKYEQKTVIERGKRGT